MSDESAPGNRNARPAVRSSREIKAGLLRRAFDGESKRSASELIALIQAACKRSATMPEDHRKILDDINPYHTEDTPRSVLMLDALARLHEEENPDGSVTRFVYTPSAKKQNAPSSPSLQ